MKRDVARPGPRRRRDGGRGVRRSLPVVASKGLGHVVRPLARDEHEAVRRVGDNHVRVGADAPRVDRGSDAASGLHRQDGHRAVAVVRDEDELARRVDADERRPVAAGRNRVDEGERAGRGIDRVGADAPARRLVDGVEVARAVIDGEERRAAPEGRGAPLRREGAGRGVDRVERNRRPVAAGVRDERPERRGRVARGGRVGGRRGAVGLDRRVASRRRPRARVVVGGRAVAARGASRETESDAGSPRPSPSPRPSASASAIPRSTPLRATLIA